MKKIAAAAVALAAVAGLSSASASTSSSSTAAPERTTYTKKFVLTEIASRNLGQYEFAGSDRVMSRATHKVVGFDSFTGVFNPRTNTVRVWVGIALSGGIIDGRVMFRNDDRFAGPITGGNGKYHDIRGTITGRSGGGNRTFVTLHYTL
jgi:hypothetical protein